MLMFNATSVGFFLGSIFDHATKATTGAMLFNLPYLVFAGYFLNLKDIYVWLRWLQYFSPIRYSTEALLRNEFENNSEYSVEFQNIHERYGYDLGVWPCVLLLLALAIVFRILAIIGLKLTVSKVQ